MNEVDDFHRMWLFTVQDDVVARDDQLAHALYARGWLVELGVIGQLGHFGLDLVHQGLGRIRVVFGDVVDDVQQI